MVHARLASMLGLTKITQAMVKKWSSLPPLRCASWCESARAGTVFQHKDLFYHKTFQGADYNAQLLKPTNTPKPCHKWQPWWRTAMSAYRDEIRNAIRTIENWPNPGVMFRDITPF